MRSRNLFWVKTLLASEVINLQWLLELQQARVHDTESVITTNSPPVSDGETQRTLLSKESITSIFDL